MLILPKWLNKFLTPEEEEQIKDPSRRIFTFGLLASAALLAAPKLPEPELPEMWITIHHPDGIKETWSKEPLSLYGREFTFSGGLWLAQ